MAKNASGAAFLNSKKRAEEIALAQESGMNINEVYQDQDKFNMQHHHLLNCLENTTVSTLIDLQFLVGKINNDFDLHYVLKIDYF